ncbi:MAG: hypothetical protein DRN25_04300 [Thermoplasmata archaeon]|nr:MAG: hypothetical protein DRN25_04300 [Thermoplasmata archaeon]
MIKYTDILSIFTQYSKEKISVEWSIPLMVLISVFFLILLVLIVMIIILKRRKKKKKVKEKIIGESLIYESPDGKFKFVLKYDVEREIERYRPKPLSLDVEDFDTRLKLIGEKYRIFPLIVIDRDGMVVSSTNSVSEEEMANFISLSLKVGIGEEIKRIELSKEEENIYISSIDVEGIKLIVIGKSRDKIPLRYLEDFEKDMIEAMSKIV